MAQYQEATLFATSASSFILFESTAATTTQGLTLINTTSFSGVSSQSVNNVFTSTYRNYRLFINAKNTSTAGLTVRLRAAGTDLTSNNYYRGRYYVGVTESLAAGNDNNGLDTAWNTTSIGTMAGLVIMDIANPQTSEVTSALTFGVGALFILLGHSLNNITTSFDGFTLTPGSGTLTGSVSVYGYNA
jgi:hypothetical protein